MNTEFWCKACRAWVTLTRGKCSNCGSGITR